MKADNIKKKYYTTLIVSVYVFFVLYNISFKNFESLTTGRLSVGLALIWFLVSHQKMNGLFQEKIWLIALPLPYVLVQFFVFGDPGQLSRFIYLFIYSYLGAALAVIIAPDIKQLLIGTLLAISFQSILIIISFFNLNFRNWLDGVITTGMNYDAQYIYRATGFTSASGAALSVIQSLGFLVVWILHRKNNFFEHVFGISTYLLIASMLAIGVSCVFTGRTGLLLSCFFLFLLLIESEARGRIIVSFSVFFISFILFFKSYLLPLLGEDFSLDYFGDWVFGRDDTIRSLAEMHIPSVSIETFLGTGLSSLVNGSNPSGHDSGFIQAYYSMGLPVSALFYGAYLVVLFRLTAWFPKYFSLGLSVLFFLIEAKEPFLFKYSTMFVLMLIHFSHLAYCRNMHIDVSRGTR